ncbi:sensor histidine kinase [Nocardioides stalactiti]|uniref:sensor histidine kinase n=1 Tax=Nocardioides stalactiti TaxID=2755356 RepID=UPI0016023B59|nr:HAMP domain-containing sensor histidine kinase [Nocardioides stalactiti]
MRERLVAAFVGLTIVVVALYGIPRAYILADLVRSQEQDQVDRTAALVATVVGERLDDRDRVDSAYLDRLAQEDERLVLRTEKANGSILVVGTSNWTDPIDGDLTSTADVPGGTLTVVLDHGAVDREVAEALLPLVLIGLALVLLSGVAGLLLARRFARPFQELATAARDFGAGRLRPVLPVYRVPEAREIADALSASGARLDALLQHEREVAVHASHELRTPITAMRLELEDLALWPETPAAVGEVLQRSVGELDRLSDAVTELLATSREQAAFAEIDLDLDALVADTVARVAALGRRVTHVPTGPLPTRLDPTAVVQALELLVGGGSEVRAADRGTHLEVSVTTAGQDPAIAARHRGPASELVAAAGGSLTQTSGGVTLRLPKRAVTEG